MIERFMYRTLERRIAEVVEGTPAFFKRVMSMASVDDDEITRLREIVIARPPRLIHAYPREDLSVPMYCIILGRRRKSAQFLGEHGKPVTPSEAQVLGSSAFTDVVSSMKGNILKVWTVTDDPDMTIHYNALLELMLDFSLDEMLEFGISDVSFSSGDVSPMESYLPHNLYVRETIVELEHEFSAFMPMQPAGAKSVLVLGDATDRTGVRGTVQNNDSPAARRGAADLAFEP